ncbi:Dehydrogenase/reductase SDR family member 12 [Tetrabaena socialis]|uniref:Dehydrogenase/reductase SDR family member 12 n=1 Tax=Tetrabaena socialis TaxID=47790 RepID=A0A2J8A029_9CHLO|nr:Dehydrogenase/reductase SDR family member 12 [Tetrabaena socialis]|eukprot:PNH05887.1 Dehydrogenase/reductase SDR family member 12 [Tetrabaena socialis]
MGVLRSVSFLMFGTKHFGKDGYARAAAKWDNSVMSRRLEGKVAMVTGANQGLGFETSQELARRGATLYMVCRNAQRGEAAVQRVRQATGNQDVHLQVCDVSSLAAVKSLAAEWEAAGRQLHLLVNNAGILVHERVLSADGHESCFATNTLGSFALTRALGGVLAASAPSRVVFVSSGGMYTAPLEPSSPCVLPPLQTRHLDHSDMRKYDGMLAYSRDKRRQVALAERFAELWAGAGVAVVSMHPGWATTEGVKQSIPGFYSFYKDKFREPAQGVDTIVWLALADGSALEPGAFYLDRAVQPKHLSLSGTQYGKDKVDELWAGLERMWAAGAGGGAGQAAASAAAQR